MITFVLELPKLAPEKQIQLEDVLLKIPRVDAFAQDDGDFSITAENTNIVLRDLVAAIYGWASDHPGMALQMKVVCPKGEMVLGKHSPNDVIHFLSTC